MLALYLGLALRSWYYVWFSLEVLNWIFLYWLDEKLALTFLVWQRICSLVFLYSWLAWSRRTGAMIGLLMKIGLPPFRGWIWRTQKNWRWWAWVIFLTFHKILPLVLLVSLFNRLLFSLSIMWIIMRIAGFYLNFRSKSFVFMSSLRDVSWLLLSSVVWGSWFWFYVFSYSFLWFVWVSSGYEWVLNYSCFDFRFILFVLILAFPPSIFFIMKVFVWIRLSLSISVVLGVMRFLFMLVYWLWFTLSRFSGRLVVGQKSEWRWVARVGLVHLFWVGWL